MQWIRRHLRIVVVLWLAGQGIAVSAVSLGDCCAGHRAPVVKKSCHGTELPAAAACPMRAADGRVCPMHRPDAVAHHRHGAESATRQPSTEGAAFSGAMHQHHQQTPPDRPACTMKSTCAGPVAALASVLFVQGVLPPPVSVPVRPDTPERVAVLADAPSSFELRPDSPPPRL